MPGPVSGLHTTDHVDLNEIYYSRHLERVRLYNQPFLAPDMRRLFTVNAGEAVQAFPIGDIEALQAAEAGTTEDQGLTWSTWQGFALRYEVRSKFTLDFFRQASFAEVDALSAASINAFARKAYREILRVGTQSGATGWFDGSNFDTAKTYYTSLTKPPNYGQSEFTATHTHYEAMARTTFDIDDPLTAIDHIRHHVGEEESPVIYGFCDSAMWKTIISWVASNNTAGTGFVHDMPIIDNAVVTGVIPSMFGIRYFVTAEMPASRVLYMAAGSNGDANNATGKPMAFIEPDNESFRGLKSVSGKQVESEPFVGSWAYQYFGVKVRNRGAGYVQQYTAAGTYANPVFKGRQLNF